MALMRSVEIGSFRISRRGRHCAVAMLLLSSLAGLSFTSSAQTTSLSASNVAFGNEAVGYTSKGIPVALTNTGTVPLNISSIVATGNFSQTNNCAGSLKAAAKCTITITFSPTATGSSSGSVVISDSASNGSQTITLAGVGVVPVKLVPVVLSFGNTNMGTTSSPLVVTLTNNLSTPLTMLSVTATGDFAQTNTCGSSVAANGTCTVTLLFTPTIGGTRDGILSVADNANDSPQTASLAGVGSATGVTSIAISPQNPSAQAGATLQFTATGTFSSGLYDVTQAVTWTSSKTAIATITSTGSGRGLAAALSPGTTTIKAAQGSVASSTTLTVGPGLVSLAVTPSNSAVGLGGTQQFIATGTYSDQSQKNLTTSVNWKSSAPAIASVNSTGLANGVGVGGASIVATLGSLSGSALLTVNPAALVSIAVTPANSSVPLGVQQQFKAVGTYTDGSTQDLTASVSWSSNAANVASVSTQGGSQGLTTGLATGTTNITGSLGNISGSTGLTITPATLVSLVVTPAVPTIPSGVTQQFTAIGTFTDGSTQNLTTLATWTSNATAVATISNVAGSQGLATGQSTGTATITATVGEASGGTTLTIAPAALLSIAVSPATSSIAQGATQSFTAVGTFSDNSTQNLTSSVTWISSVASVASINSSGVAVGMSAGTSSISATLGTITGVTTITVTATALVSISVNPSVASLSVGATQMFTAIGTFSDGSSQDVTASVYWTSSNGAIATISDAHGSQGLASTLSAGVTTITATSFAVSGSANLTVTQAALQSIVISPQNVSVALGSSQAFSASGLYSDGSTQDLTTTVTWGSSQPSVAVISNASGAQGVATTAGAGTTSITAIFGAQSAQTNLTVAPASLLSIAVSPSSTTIAVGASQQFTAIGTFSDGSQRDVTAQGLWTSTNSSVASVTAGLATAIGAGSTTIQCALSVSGSASLTALVTVPTPPTGISVSTGNMQVSLTWLPSLGATSYTVARSTMSLGPYTAVASVSTNSFNDIGLTNNTTYYYVVAAVSSAGASAYSSQVNATPQILPGAGSARIYFTTWNGLAREYVVYVPARLQANPAMVLVLHGTAIVPQSQPPLTVYHNMGWDQLADAYGFLVVQPIATYKPSTGSFFWESFGTETYFPTAPDDSGFLRSLILSMQRSTNSGGFGVDSNRVFVMGFSSGGMMTHTLAINSSDLIAAAAPFSGTIYVATPPNPFPQPTQPVSIIEFAGDADTTIYYCGGTFHGWGEGLVYSPSIDVDANYWLTADGLSGNPNQLCTNGEPSPNVYQFDSGPAKIEVQIIRELGFAHNYQQTGMGMAWEFFSTHGR
jgi:poly(3-hydroxybutyrate) depolymerase